jgi:hypothetical protein
MFIGTQFQIIYRNNSEFSTRLFSFKTKINVSDVGATRLRAVFVMQMPYVLTSANTNIVLEAGITD